MYYRFNNQYYYICIKMLRMNNSSLDVISVGKMLKCTLREASLFTELPNRGIVVMCKHTISQNCVSDLWVCQ